MEALEPPGGSRILLPASTVPEAWMELAPLGDLCWPCPTSIGSLFCCSQHPSDPLKDPQCNKATPASSPFSVQGFQSKLEASCSAGCPPSLHPTSRNPYMAEAWPLKLFYLLLASVTGPAAVV